MNSIPNKLIKRPVYCKECGKPFLRVSPNHNQKYCSLECKEKGALKSKKAYAEKLRKKRLENKKNVTLYTL